MIVRLKIWVRMIRIFIGYTAPVARELEWTEVDQDTLRRYLKSDQGQKLIEALKLQEAQQNASAVLRVRMPELEYAAGYAAGYRASLAFILSLSGGISREDPKTGDTDAEMGADELAERYSP